MPHRRALVVAVNAYQDERLRELRAPAKDAEALAEVLADPAIGSFTVQQLRDATKDQVEEEIEGLLGDAGRDELVLLYFSCHGVKDASGRFHFAVRNTKLNRLGSTAVASSFVIDQMTASRCRSVVVVLDCCYSGAFARGLVGRDDRRVDVTDRLQESRRPGQGRVVITASTALEYAFEGDAVSTEEAGPSVFTAALTHGLRSGDADLDRDGLVSVDELFDYVTERVRAAVGYQTPTKSQHGVQGMLALARSPRGQGRPLPGPTADPETSLAAARQVLRHGPTNEAVRAYRTLSRSPDPTVSATAAIELGRLLESLGNAAGALPLYRAAAASPVPELAERGGDLVRSLSARGADPARLAEALAAAHRLAARGDSAGAERTYRAVLAGRHPDHVAIAARRLGDLLAGAGRDEEAQEAYRTAAGTEHPAEAPIARLHLGRLHARRGRRAAALTLLAGLADPGTGQSPGSPPATAAAAELARLLAEPVGGAATATPAPAEPGAPPPPPPPPAAAGDGTRADPDMRVAEPDAAERAAEAQAETALWRAAACAPAATAAAAYQVLGDRAARRGQHLAAAAAYLRALPAGTVPAGLPAGATVVRALRAAGIRADRGEPAR